MLPVILLLSLQVYLGNGLKISRDDLYEVGGKTSLNSKVGALITHYFTDGPENYSLSGRSKYKDKVLKKFSEDTKDKMKSKSLHISKCTLVQNFL